MSLIDQIAKQHYAAPPKGWQTKKIKFLADIQTSNVDKLTVDEEELVRLCNYTDVYYNDRITPDLPFMEATATRKEIEKFTLQAGQVFITKDSEGWDDIGIPALVTEDMPGVLCGYHLAIFTPDSDKLDGAFLAWLCRADALNDQFKLSANGVTRFGLGQYPMKNAVVGYPPLETQKRIAAFLDEKTAKIDALIARKQALLERLAEKRQAIITQAVTKGLNPAAPLKDSGIDWLGQIPAHWDVKRVKHIARLESGHTPDKKMDEYWEDGDIDWVSLNDTAKIRANDYISETKFKTNAAGLANSSARMLPARAVAFTRDATIGECAITTKPMAVSQHIIAWICDEKLISSEFLLLLIYGMTGELKRLTNGATIGTIGLGDVKELRVCVPDIQEQSQIVKWVFDLKSRIDDTAGIVRSSVDSLTEYRSALITSAVTGQIDGLR
ncbi:MAG: restriction endonuclease subunit S [Sphingomonadales bacterium]|nr:restriction endonuclease subunit S [Sphingomonadales bacterium]